MNARLILLLVLLCVPATLSAGLWDRDRPEGDDLPSAFDVISGRFDRLPDDVYRQRLERVNAALDELPKPGDELTEETAGHVIDALPLYDDAAVAQFRLGDFGAAIITLDRKSLQIERIRDFHAAEARRHELRYLANKAACLQHRWMDSGDRADLELAKKLLERALEIDRFNWDAGWSLTEVEWLLSNPKYERGQDPIFPNLLGLVDADFRGKFEPAALARNGIEGCVEYLSRRIVYENGYEDVDLMYALSLGLTLTGQRQEAIFAWFRVGELLETGKDTRVVHALKPGVIESLLGVHLGELQEETDQRKLYQELRRVSDEYVASRNRYAEGRLEAGEHPDTDAAFWAGWTLEEPAPIQPGQVPETEDPAFSRTVILGGVAALVGIFILLFLAMMLLGRNKSPHPTVDEL